MYNRVESFEQFFYAKDFLQSLKVHEVSFWFN